MRTKSKKQSVIKRGKAVVILAIVCLSIPTAYLVRTMFDSYRKAEVAGDRATAIDLAEADAKLTLLSGRKALVAHCLPAQPPAYPLLETLENADCIKRSLSETICLGGRIPNDVINPVEDPWRKYEPKDHDPRSTEAYAVAFNNTILNSMATSSHCFIETTSLHPG